MDPLTHGLAGAAAAHLVSGKEDSKIPFLTGFLSAQIPDLDIIFQAAFDPLTGVELHRHFTHSILFAPFGAIVAAGLFWFILQKKISPGKLYGMVLAAWMSAVLLDACTSYGTHLLLPLTDQVVSWNLISVVDPVVTLGMLIFAVYSLKNKGVAGSVLMMFWLGLFLIFGGVQNYRVSAYADKYIQDQEDYEIERYVVKPTIGNQLLWRYTFISSDSVYTLGVRAGIFRGMHLYEGQSALLRSPLDEDFEQLPQRQKQDIARFWKLADGYMISHPGNPNILGDARYSMLPTSLIPLWGIDISGRGDNSPTPFLYFRDSGPEMRKAYVNMLLGKTEE